MSDVLQPLFWRLANDHNAGIDVVSVLMPHGRKSDKVAIEYAIDVSFKSSDHHTSPIDLCWSEEDSALFMNLLRKVLNITEKEVQLDIADNTVQGLIHLVATARFHTPRPGDEIEGEDFITYRKNLEVGDLIAVNTAYGFCSAVIVALDSIDATVILLDNLMNTEEQGGPEGIDEEVVMPRNSLLMLNRVCILPPEFAAGITAVVLH